ncbi:kinase-like domain-containing protein [Daedaleopsis nitida]|nr:kinase-like domain-containing protein [Daedaleopsis nitida]
MICASDALPDFTNVTISHYNLVRMLGTGTFGVVYKALDTLHSTSETKIHRAMKIVRKAGRSPHELAMMRREIALHSAVAHHPGIVTLHDAWDDDEYFYLVLEYCAAGDLFDQLEDGIYADDDELVRSAFLSLIDAVQACHDAGIAHRDLKPEDVLVNGDCTRTFLADFGLATNHRQCKDFGTGTPTYMAPECFGRKPYSPFASDIWALGMILVNLISGMTPWMEATPSDDAFAQFLDDPFYFRHRTPISPDAHDILMRILELEPAERISLRDLRSEIVDVESFFNGDGDRPLLEPFRLTQSLVGTAEDGVHSITSKPSSEYSEDYFPSTSMVPGLSPSGSSDAGTTHTTAMSVSILEDRCQKVTELESKETTTRDMVERWRNAALCI